MAWPPTLQGASPPAGEVARWSYQGHCWGNKQTEYFYFIWLVGVLWLNIHSPTVYWTHCDFWLLAIYLSILHSQLKLQRSFEICETGERLTRMPAKKPYRSRKYRVSTRIRERPADSQWYSQQILTAFSGKYGFFKSSPPPPVWQISKDLCNFSCKFRILRRGSSQSASSHCHVSGNFCIIK